MLSSLFIDFDFDESADEHGPYWSWSQPTENNVASKKITEEISNSDDNLDFVTKTNVRLCQSLGNIEKVDEIFSNSCEKAPEHNQMFKNQRPSKLRRTRARKSIQIDATPSKKFKSSHVFIENLNIRKALDSTIDLPLFDSEDDFDLPDLKVSSRDCGSFEKLMTETKITEPGSRLAASLCSVQEIENKNNISKLKPGRRFAKTRNGIPKTSSCQYKNSQRLICRKNVIPVNQFSHNHAPYKLLYGSVSLCEDNEPEWIVLTRFSMTKQLFLDVLLDSMLSSMFSSKIPSMLLSFCIDNNEPPPVTSKLILKHLGQLTDVSRAYSLYASLMEIACVNTPRNELPVSLSSLQGALIFCVDQIGRGNGSNGGTNVDGSYLAKVLSLDYMVTCLEFEIVNHGLWKFKRQLQSSQCYKLLASDAKMEEFISNVRWKIYTSLSMFIQCRFSYHLWWKSFRLLQRLTSLLIYVNNSPLSKAEKQVSDLVKIYNKTSELDNRISILRLTWCPLQRMLLSRQILDTKFYRRQSLMNWTRFTSTFNLKLVLKNYFQIFVSHNDMDELVLKSEEDAEEFVTTLYFLIESCIHVIKGI